MNTGWTGGPYGIGKRIALKYTRAIVNAILDEKLDKAHLRYDEIFNLYVPVSCPNVPAEVMDPRKSWKDDLQYLRKANRLAEMFVKNFEKFGKDASYLVKAGPLPASFK